MDMEALPEISVSLKFFNYKDTCIRQDTGRLSEIIVLDY